MSKSIVYRAPDGAYCSKEEYSNYVMRGEIKPGDNIEVYEEKSSATGLTPEEEAQVPEGILAKLKAKALGLMSGPVASTLVDINRDSIKLAAAMRIGSAYNGFVRTNLISPLLPAALHPMLLDNKVGAACIDLAGSQLALSGTIMFQDHLPPMFTEWGGGLFRAATTEAWVRAGREIPFDEFFNHFAAGPLMSLAKEAKAAGL